LESKITLAKKKDSWLQMPKLHSKFNDPDLEEILINKAIQLLTVEDEEIPSFIFLSGQFFDVKNTIHEIMFA